ncbi:hypothetical protein PtB15_4B434 [Puccinia triticina]|nr:hypothetical protein PtB15_4B434 [Puccinia triticina]
MYKISPRTESVAKLPEQLRRSTTKTICGPSSFKPSGPRRSSGGRAGKLGHHLRIIAILHPSRLKSNYLQYIFGSYSWPAKLLMTQPPHMPGETNDFADDDQHSEIFGQGSASLYGDYLTAVFGSKLRFAEQHNTGRPDRPNTLDNLSYFHRSGPSETKQQCRQDGVFEVLIYGQPAHPPTRGVHAPQVPSNLRSLSQHSPVQVSQQTYLGSDHPVFAPGYPWPVEEQIGNPMHPIQPPLAQRSHQNDYKNPKNLKIFTPVSNKFLSHHPVESSKFLGLGPQDSQSSPNHTTFQLPNIDYLRTADPSQAHQDYPLLRGTTDNNINPDMSYAHLYSPKCYYTNGRPAYPASGPDSLYPCCSPYQRNFPLSSPYVPSTYFPPPSSTTPQQRTSVNEEDFYLPISHVYESAKEPELDRLLNEKTESILSADPFCNKIDVDYGYGPLPSLADYKIDKTKLGYHDTFNLDDLYLLEMALRLDELLTDKERLRRWDQRLDWENADDKTKLWGRMSDLERSRIGIGVGSWWTYRLFGIPFCSRYGYYRTLIGPGGVFSMRYGDFRKGAIEAHYPLIGTVKSRFPMFRDGGLGLGRALSAWVDGRPVRPPSRSEKSDAKSNEAQEDQNRNLELQKRWFRAQCNRSNLINAIMQISTVVGSPRIPQAYYPVHGHPPQPPYLYPRGFEAGGFGHQLNRSIYEQVAGNSPGGFHSGFPTPSFPHQTLRPQPLKRSVSFTSPGNGGTYAQYSKNYIDPANLYNMRPIPNPTLNYGNSKDSSQNPSIQRPASRAGETRPASTGKRNSQRQETEPVSTRKDFPPQNSRPEPSSNRNATESVSTSIPNSGLPKPPQIYTSQMIADRMNASHSRMRPQTQSDATNLKL